MQNPFNISEIDLKELLHAYREWLKKEKNDQDYASKQKQRDEELLTTILNSNFLENCSDQALSAEIKKYINTLEGPVRIRLGQLRIQGNITQLKNSLLYIIESKDDPFDIANAIIDGEKRIPIFAKGFWTPLLHARYPYILPNWNNKTGKFFRKFNVNLNSSKLSLKEKYKLISNAFTYLLRLDPSQNFYTLNHLMHYGTAIDEGIELINKITPALPKTTLKIEMTIDELKERIKALPSKTELTSKLERELGLNENNQEFWDGWLSEYGEPGPYNRKKLTEGTGRIVYNRLQAPFMLLWLGEATSISREIILSAIKAFREAKPNLATQCAAIRKKIPWDLIENALENIIINPRLEASEEELVLHDPNYSTLPQKEKETIILARIGQGKYREQLISYWGKCSVTSCTAIKLLNASHIKPWKDCNTIEALDLYNGLLLTPNLDKLLDRGLISFQDTGQILISSKLTKQDLQILGIDESMKIEKIAEPHKIYLSYHRNKVFIK